MTNPMNTGVNCVHVQRLNSTNQNKIFHNQCVVYNMTVEIHALLLISICISGIFLIIVDVIVKSVNKISSSHTRIIMLTCNTSQLQPFLSKIVQTAASTILETPYWNFRPSWKWGVYFRDISVPLVSTLLHFI